MFVELRDEVTACIDERGGRVGVFGRVLHWLNELRVLEPMSRYVAFTTSSTPALDAFHSGVTTTPYAQPFSDIERQRVRYGALPVNVQKATQRSEREREPIKRAFPSSARRFGLAVAEGNTGLIGGKRRFRAEWEGRNVLNSER